MGGPPLLLPPPPPPYPLIQFHSHFLFPAPVYKYIFLRSHCVASRSSQDPNSNFIFKTDLSDVFPGQLQVQISLSCINFNVCDWFIINLLFSFWCNLLDKHIVHIRFYRNNERFYSKCRNILCMDNLELGYSRLKIIPSYISRHYYFQSLYFGKMSKFPVFSLSEIYFGLPFFLLSMCNGDLRN